MVATLLAAFLALATTLPAQQTAWTNTGTAGSWTNKAIWTSINGYPNGLDTVAFFTVASGGARNITNDVAITNGTLRFAATATQGFNLWSNSGASRLYLGVNSGNAVVDNTGSSAVSMNQVIMPVTLLSALAVSNSGQLYFAGAISNSGNTISVDGIGNTYLQQPVVGGGGLVKTGSGALNLTGTNSYTGGTLVSGGLLVGNSASLQGAITNNAKVQFLNTAAGIFNGVMSGSGSLVVSNNSNITLSFTNANSYSGGTTVRLGSLILTNQGAITSSTGLLVQAGGTVLVDNRGAVLADRIGDTASLVFSGGNLALWGNGSALTETVGAINVTDGGTVLTVTNGAALSAAGLSRTGRGTLNLAGSNGAVTLASVPLPNPGTNGILPWAFVNGANYATYDTNASGQATLRAYNSYVPTFTGNPSDNVRYSSSVAATNGTMTVNSLVLDTNMAVTDGNTLTLASGGLLLTRANQTLSGGTISFGAAEGIVYNDGIARVFSALVGANGLTKAGAGNLILAGPATISGTTWVNGGILSVTNAGGAAVGALTNDGAVIVNQGTFSLFGGSATLGTLAVSNWLASTASLDFEYGTLTLLQGSTLYGNGDMGFGKVSGQTANLFLGGTNLTTINWTGSYNVNLGNGGTVNVTLAGSNSVWQIQAAGLRVGNSSGGNSLVISNGGSVVASGLLTLGQTAGAAGNSNTVLVTDAGSMFTNGGAINVGLGAGAAFNSMVVSNRGLVSSAGAATLGGNSNLLLVSDGGTFWTNYGNVNVGNGGNQNLMVISNGAFMQVGGSGLATTFTLGTGAGNTYGTNNTVLVTGTGSTLRLDGSGAINLGTYGVGNAFIVTNGGQAFSMASASSYNRIAERGTNTLVLVSGSNSLLSMAGSVSLGHSGGSLNTVLVNGGGTFSNGNGVTVGFGSGANSNRIVVADRGSLMTVGGTLTIAGNANAGSQVVISNGANLVANRIWVGSAIFSTGNLVATGPGTLVQVTGGFGLEVGTNGSINGAGSVLVADGATLEAVKLNGGLAGSGTISNIGGIYQFTNNAPVIQPNTANAIALSGGTISFRAMSNADVKANWTGSQLTNISFSGANTFRLNAASNFAAGPQDYTFATGLGASNYASLEMINRNTAWRSAWLNVGSGGSLLLSNTTATVAGTVTNLGAITVSGASVTWLSNVVLAAGSYTARAGTNAFASGVSVKGGATMTLDALSTLQGSVNNDSLVQVLAGGTLALTNGQNLTGSGTLNVAAGGLLSLSNGAFTVANSVVSSGQVNVVNSMVTYGAPVTISALYRSDPSTNTFATNVVVTPSGALSGGAGDLFVFQGDLVNQSTNRAQFSLSQSAVLFSNSGSHLLVVSNSGSLDIGQGFQSFAEVATNFAIGQLSVAADNRLTLTGNKDSRTNALYVGWLDLQGAITNSFDAATNSLFLALNLPDINLYYDKYDPRNAWLNEWIPATGYDLWGGGLLLPIPEPGSFAMLALGAAALLAARRAARRGAGS